MTEWSALPVSAPQYLNEVEQVIGLRFLPEPHEEWLAHNDPLSVKPEDLWTYEEVYRAGLRLLVVACIELDIPRSNNKPLVIPPEDLREIRALYADERERLVHHLISAAQIVPRVPEGAVPESNLCKVLKVGSYMLLDMVDELNPIFITLRNKLRETRGSVYLPANEVARMKELAGSLPIAGPDDVKVEDLQSELKISSEGFVAAVHATGVAIVEKYENHNSPRLAHVTGAASRAIRAYIEVRRAGRRATPAGERPYGLYGPSRPRSLPKVINTHGAFPAGERPYGSYGPSRAMSDPEPERRPGRRREEVFTLQTQAAEVTPAPLAPYRPGTTLAPRISRPSSYSLTGRGRRRHEIPLPDPSPRPRSPKLRQPRHLPEGLESWRQTVPMPVDRFISSTEVLSVTEIAHRLGICEEDVQAAISRIDPGEHRPEIVQGETGDMLAYTGELLIAIREQLVGIPLRYLEVSHSLTPAELEQARILLARKQFEQFSGDRYSPAAIDFIANNLATVKAAAKIKASSKGKEDSLEAGDFSEN